MRSLPVFSMAIVSLALCGGCAGLPEVYFDERADFGAYRTWSWLPNSARTIDAPTPYAIGLDRELARLVERQLFEQGFERVEQGGDLRIGAVLNVRREYVNVVETGAMQQLSTYTSDGVYEIQRSIVRKETWERVRLVVFAMSPLSGEAVWKGVLEKRSKGEFPKHVKSVVTGLLASFPAAGAGRTLSDPHALAASPPAGATTSPPLALEPDA